MRWFALSMLVACAIPPPPAPPDPPPAPDARDPRLAGRLLTSDRLPPAPSPSDEGYRLQQGDLVQVGPARGPVLLRARIDHDGRTVRLGDGLPVDADWSGRTIADLRAELRERFPRIPSLRVHVRPHFQCAHLVTVVRDGAADVPWSSGLRLHEALDRAGALPLREGDVWIVRRADGVFIRCDVRAFFASADPRHDPALEPADIVVVLPPSGETEGVWSLMLALLEGAATPDEVAASLRPAGDDQQRQVPEPGE